MTDDAAGHFLRNIFAAPAGPGPPYTHTFDPSPLDPAEAVAWLREQVKMDHNRWRATLRQVRPVDAGGITVLPGGLEALAQWEDARDHVADCEAKLALLDICERVIREDEPGDGDWSGLAVARIAIRFLAAGFRHRDRYSRYWGDPITHTITESGQ